MSAIDAVTGQGGAAERASQLIKLKMLYDNAIRAVVASSAAALIAVMALGHLSNPSDVLLWIAALLGVNACRTAAIGGFRRQKLEDINIERWTAYYAIGVVVSGMIWGVFGYIFYPENNPEHLVLIALVIAGVLAGAASTMAPMPSVYTAYLAVVVLPFLSRLATSGATESYELVLMSIGFVYALISSARSSAAVLDQSLRLRHANESLLADVQQANARLVEENEQRQKTELDLLHAKTEAEEAARAKSQFLANMSHEIRTPMNGVFGMTDLLMRTSLDDRQRKLVRTVHDSAKSLLTIINDILDLSRIEAGRLELDAHEFNLPDAVERSVDLFAGQLNDKGLEVTLFIDRNVPLSVKGDSGRLKQVLLNLIGNAMKFTRHGEVSVRVDQVKTEDNKSLVSFTVSDTGIGIDSQMREKLFKPFTQAETSVSRRFGGTGLGLSISRHLVEMMGGKIELHSELGKGTRVCFQIPLEHGSASIGAAHSDFTVLNGARILVLDDRETNRDIIGSYLADCGAEVTRAVHCDEAFGHLQDAAEREKPFHAAVVDMIMPDQSGLEFAGMIRNDARLSRLKIILATSLDIHSDAREVRELDIEAVLTKPIRRHDLVDVAARAIAGTRHPGWRTALLERTENDRARQLPPLNGNVLLVEDNPVNVEVAQEFLGAMGCTVSVASNGLEALALLAAHPFDAVLMDCQMPIMDGFSTTRRFRHLEAERGVPRTHIIAVTANAFAEDRERCKDAGMDDYLSKPFTQDQLRAVLARWMPRPGATAATLKIEAETVAQNASTPADGAPQTGKASLDNASPAVPVVDDAVLSQLRKSRPDLLARLLKAYFSYAPKAVEELAAAAARGDIAAVGTQAHSLKSSSANIGGTALSELCKDIERLARAGDPAAADRASAVPAAFAALRAALQPAQAPAADDAIKASA